MAPSIEVITTSAANGDHAVVGQHFWNANLPSSQWTEECPDFLLGQATKNIGILSGKQEDYHTLEWPEAKELVGELRQCLTEPSIISPLL